MTPSEKQHWRYTFAGQAFANYSITNDSDTLDVGAMLKDIDALLAALEASAPAPDPFEQARKYPCKHGMRYLKGAETCFHNCFGDQVSVPKELRLRDLRAEIEERMECLRQLNCEHEWRYEGLVKACNKCGAFE